MPTITYLTSGKSIEVGTEANLLRTSIRHGGEVPFKCGGGLCGTCRVKVVEGRENLSKVMRKEFDRLGRERIEEGYRLACQTFVDGDVTLVWGTDAESLPQPAPSTRLVNGRESAQPLSR